MAARVPPASCSANFHVGTAHSHALIHTLVLHNFRTYRSDAKTPIDHDVRSSDTTQLSAHSLRHKDTHTHSHADSRKQKLPRMRYGVQTVIGTN
ncbi:hypothetical protein MHYP_G00297200 [Metynnis hypsauchen]